MLKKHEQLLEMLQEVQKMASDLCVKGCAMRPIVAGLREVEVLMKDRIREYKNPPKDDGL